MLYTYSVVVKHMLPNNMALFVSLVALDTVL